ncbi:cysteine sulfinic acid decarboxylase-like isoform X2 [Watersipora subatra]|uniref:cysteine sulfinic acid decarboxylase-like isoform X2 n=1 Tax=Watersipora subatra TaxID=2589382 RepID=UPI00355B9862
MTTEKLKIKTARQTNGIGNYCNGKVLPHTNGVSSEEDFLDAVMNKFLKEILKCYEDRSRPILEFYQPEELRKRVDLSLKEQSMSDNELKTVMEQVVRYSVKTGHPHFFNQLFGGVDRVALSGAILAEALNTSGYTFEVAPVFTLMERELVQKLCCEFLHFPQGDGIFCPGGSAANMNALSLARYYRYPFSKTQGMRALPPVHLYTSKSGHYSLSKAAFFLGFGLDNIVGVETDDVGRMIPGELDKAIKKSISMGFEPLFVNATAGTTVMGAFDPIEEIAEICRRNQTGKEKIWLHVDAAWGGSAILSPKLRHKLRGVEKADSFTWDPHKMAGPLLQCSVILTRHVGLLANAHSAKAKYLFQQDKVYDISYDTGDKSIQCGRKVDALKLWVQWKSRGTEGLAKDIEKCFDTALYLRDRLETTPGFRLLISEPECTNVCFWYIPKCMRGKVAPAIKARMQQKGSMLVGYQPQGEFVNFFRMVVAKANHERQDMDFVVSTISSYGEELFKE